MALSKHSSFDIGGSRSFSVGDGGVPVLSIMDGGNLGGRIAACGL